MEKSARIKTICKKCGYVAQGNSVIEKIADLRNHVNNEHRPK